MSETPLQLVTWFLDNYGNSEPEVEDWNLPIDLKELDELYGKIQTGTANDMILKSLVLEAIEARNKLLKSLNTLKKEADAQGENHRKRKQEVLNWVNKATTEQLYKFEKFKQQSQ